VLEEGRKDGFALRERAGAAMAIIGFIRVGVWFVKETFFRRHMGWKRNDVNILVGLRKDGERRAEFLGTVAGRVEEQRAENRLRMDAQVHRENGPPMVALSGKTVRRSDNQGSGNKKRRRRGTGLIGANDKQSSGKERFTETLRGFFLL